MKILIIGGAGYIGTSLTKMHVDFGDDVYILDDLSNPLVHNTEESYVDSDITFVRGDVLDISMLMSSYGNPKFDLIYHLASESRPLEFSKKYRDIISSNIIGLMSVVDYIKNNLINDTCRLVFASTSEVYGYNYKSLNESDDLIVNPQYKRNCYSLSKILSENILYNEPSIDWNIVRFFNVYGGDFNINDTKVIPMLKRCTIDNDTFEIFGDGEQTRSFTYIDDLVNALVRVGVIKTKHETFNLGMDIQTTINELVGMVKIHYPELKVEYKPSRKGEPYLRLPDNTKAKKILNWSPQISLKDGINCIFG